MTETAHVHQKLHYPGADPLPEGEQWLQDRIRNADPNISINSASIPAGYGHSNAPPTADHSPQMDECQWQIGPNGTFRASPQSTPRLPAGVYVLNEDNNGVFLKVQPLLSDSIVELPDGYGARALDGIKRFWRSRARYQKHGLLYKRGCLFYGPAGSGKTVVIRQLVLDLIACDGIVIYCDDPRKLMAILPSLRRVEPDRNLIVILEDIEELIARFGENEILSLLDGGYQIDNVVWLATTNYPEKLKERIVNRPSRFDDRIFVGMPSYGSRLTYLQKAVLPEDSITFSTLEKWAHDTDKLSIAHLRELVAAVMCLEQEYAEVIVRLHSMTDLPKDEDGFRKKKMGMV